jgi:hypothetical protein
LSKTLPLNISVEIGKRIEALSFIVDFKTNLSPPPRKSRNKIRPLVEKLILFVAQERAKKKFAAHNTLMIIYEH